jgi:hypothetical protein
MEGVGARDRSVATMLAIGCDRIVIAASRRGEETR